MKYLLVLFICLLALSNSIFAVVATPNSLEVSFGIDEFVILEINSSYINFGDLNPANSPAQLNNATTLNIRSNLKNSWTLRVKASGDLMSNQYSEETIPLNQLKFRGGDVSEYTSLDTNPITIRTAPAGQETVNIDYQLTVGYSDAAASGYQTLIMYELIAY